MAPGGHPMSRKSICLIIVSIVAVIIAAAVVLSIQDGEKKDHPVIVDGLPGYSITGETGLDGNFFISFVYSKNLIMLDGKGNVIWSKHEDLDEGVYAGCWDFKKHVVNGKTYYSYHDQVLGYDKYGIEGYAPGDRVIMDENYNEIRRINFEESDTVYKGHPLDGHDFLLIDLDHYIMSGYIKEVVYNVPGYPQGSSVVYSYLQEVDHGEVVWDFKTIDYPELYSLTVTDAVATANDFGNVQTDAPDYVHFNAMRLDYDGHLVCSYRHLNTIMCLDRTKATDQIIWKLSGKADDFGLSDDQKTSSQHYVTVNGNDITVFDNHNITGETCVRTFSIDDMDMRVDKVTVNRIDGKLSSACGSAQLLYGNTYMLGWGRTENDSVCMCVYDFDADEELIRMTLDNKDNFTYRCVYYE